MKKEKLRPPYADEFEEEMNLLEFSRWVLRNIRGMRKNLDGHVKPKPTKTLYDWLSWLLDWSEYSDYVEWKNNE